MKADSVGIRFFATWAICLFGGAVALGQDDFNPFSRPIAAPTEIAAPPPSPLNDFEFKGVYALNGEVKVCVFNKAQNKSYWLKLGERHESGLLAKSFNEDRDEVLLQQGTQMRTVSLNRSEIVAVKTPPSPVRVATPLGPQVAGGGPRQKPAAQPQSDDEVRARMQKVAEEIRKRREMRRSIIEEGAPDQR